MSNDLIVVVEDEPNIAEVVSLYLRRSGFRVSIAHDGYKAMEILEEQEPDLVILDLMLPGFDGFELTRWLRKRGDTPIIMLTARRDEFDRISGLEMGADDYVLKPFSPPELVSRVRAVLRRTQKRQNLPEEKPLIYSELVIDPQKRMVTVGGEGIYLTVKEFDLLWLLARYPRRVFTRDQILETVWGISDFIDPSTVTVHIRRLREKIENDPSNPLHLLTVWGVGYKFEP